MVLNMLLHHRETAQIGLLLSCISIWRLRDAVALLRRAEECAVQEKNINPYTVVHLELCSTCTIYKSIGYYLSIDCPTNIAQMADRKTTWRGQLLHRSAHCVTHAPVSDNTSFEDI